MTIYLCNNISIYIVVTSTLLRVCISNTQDKAVEPTGSQGYTRPLGRLTSKCGYSVATA